MSVTRLAPSLVLSSALHGALAAAVWFQFGTAPAGSVTLLELVGPEGPGPAGFPASGFTRPAVSRSPRVARPLPTIPRDPAPPKAPLRPEPGPSSEAPAPDSPVSAAATAPEAASEQPRPIGPSAGGDEAGVAGGGLLPPRILTSELPRYPESARRAGSQGTTVLRVRVGADGTVRSVLIERSSGHPDLDEAAREAVATWRFEPARRRGIPVELWILLPVQFTLG